MSELKTLVHELITAIKDHDKLVKRQHVMGGRGIDLTMNIMESGRDVERLNTLIDAYDTPLSRAAPELLAALELFVASYGSLVDIGNAYRQAVAAIANAKGGSL